MRPHRVRTGGVMPQPKAITRFLCALAVVLACAGGFWLWKGRGIAIAHTHQPFREIQISSGERVSGRNVMPGPVSQPANDLDRQSEGPGLIEHARPKMLDLHPDMAQFRWLEHKALRTREEQQLRRDMLADAEMIRYTRDRLLASRSGPLTREDELERIYRVEFLAAAIEEPSNPGRADALDAIEDVIMADSVRADMSLELQKSLTGDKMELYMALLHDAPERADDVARQAENTPTEALVKYSSTKYHTWNDSDDRK